jgi:glutaredoxin-dependent peroxiredoxin
MNINIDLTRNVDTGAYGFYDARIRPSFLEEKKLKLKTDKTIMAIAVGSKAPDFSLKSKTASGLADVKLSENFGKKNTVLLFFPLAFTSVCTQEMCDITAGLSQYSGQGADVIGVSVDSPFAQEAWANQNKITIRLASDLNKETAKAYGVLLPDLIGLGSVSARAAFVIDKNGTVVYSEQTPTPKELPNFNAVKDALAKLK